MWHQIRNILIIVIICYIHNGTSESRIDPLVDSKVGLIRGLRATDGDYSMFMGIPYATVNENNPFGPSTPHPGFDDIFEAYDDSAICPQLVEFNNTIAGSLDCLHINIYVPNAASSRNKLPVLVWIYGGGFTRGFSGRYLYGPQYIVKQDVVLVTFNYRLGPYGFMCLGTPDVPGNQGLKDQQIALRWIKNNIEAFGGDTNKITAFGESAGGSSVDFHLMYGQEKLFHQAIMQSGVSVCPWALVEPDTSAPLTLAKQLGFVTTDASEALKFVAKIDPKLVIASSLELGFTFKACVEKQQDDVEQFIYDYPINIKKVNVENLPILMGYNSDEGLAQYENLSPDEYSALNIFYDTMANYLRFESEDLTEIEAEIRHFYIGDEKFSEEVKASLTRFYSDFNFNYPVTRIVEKYINIGAKNIYFYLFFYDGDRNFTKKLRNVTTAGVAHADEIGYLFDISYMDEKPSGEDQLIIDRLTTMWANFVKYGNPTPAVTELLPIKWPVVTQDLLNYLHIDTELKIEKRHFKSRMAWWDLFYKMYEKYQLGYKENDNL